MTLIVGRISAGKVYIFGDTKLTFQHKQNANPFVEGCLKQYIVNDQLAIAFAGVKEHFEDVCSDFLKCCNAQEIVDIAIKTQKHGLDYELMIADAKYDKLRFVKEACIEKSAAGYIGDSDAFNSFQGYFHSAQGESFPEPEIGRAYFQVLQLPEPVDSEKTYLKLFQSLKSVIWDKNIPSVGGVIVPLCTHKGIFRYMGYADVISDPINISDITEEPTPIEFGTAEHGGYSVEFWDDTPNGGAGMEVGFYFLQGGFGISFPKGIREVRNATIVKAENPAYWVLETRKLLGHGISSGYLSEDHCIRAGEKLLKAEQYEYALFCYELRKDSKSLIERPAVYDRYMAGYATAMFNCGKKADAVNLLQPIVNDSKNNPYCCTMLAKMRDLDVM